MSRVLCAVPDARMTNASAVVRRAREADLDAIRTIYNEGIEDRTATLDVDPKSDEDILQWWEQHSERYLVLVATESGRIVGWASLNRFSHRCAHADIADVSVYVARSCRGRGIGAILLSRLIQFARQHFSKIVLHALNRNERGKRRYRKLGFEEVGVFRRHGRLDGELVDIIAMEILL